MVQEIITKLSAANSLQESGLDCTKMKGQKKTDNYYRIRAGDFRMGIEYLHPNVIAICLLVRGQIYKNFPPGKKK